MKTCLLCSLRQADDTSTCPECGEATFSEPVADEPKGEEPAGEEPKPKRSKKGS